MKAKLLHDTEKDIRIAAEALKQGLLVAFPTETVYGLGGDAFNPTALAHIFEAKARPRFDPLIIHIASYADLERVADIAALSPQACKTMEKLSQSFWPGPLTLILPKRPELPGLATSGLDTVAIRWPSHPLAQKLITWSCGAVAAPSANSFGHLSPTTAAHVSHDLGGAIDYIIDGGASSVGVESTVLDLTSGLRILRPGGVTREEIEETAGRLSEQADTASATSAAKKIQAPGQLPSHYAPRTPLFVHEHDEMMALKSRPGEAQLFFSGDVIEAAAHLFQRLHELDSGAFSCIHAELPPARGLGEAIRDRLIRAAAGFPAEDHPA